MSSSLVGRISTSVGEKRADILGLFREMVLINSHSANTAGVNEVGDLAVSRMPNKLKHRIHTDNNGVNHHVFTGGGAASGHVLLVGHLDTVFPVDSPFRYFEERGDRVHGPGTIDMKGGVVVIIEALRVLDELGLLGKIPLKCLFNGDEELGSPRSQALVRELGEGALNALLFEAGGQDNQVVIGRRGVVRYKLTTTGQARHAGVKEGPKASAIVELCRLILALEALNDQERGITINVGVISGGVANNIVPDNAQATFEFRFRQPEAEKEVTARIQELAASVTTPGCGAAFEIHHRRPCMVPVPGTDELVAVLKKTAGLLGQKIETEYRGGASDGNFLSEMGVPVIDGLGPVGDMDHSDKEYAVTKTVFERIELTALLLCKLAGIEG